MSFSIPPFIPALPFFTPLKPSHSTPIIRPLGPCAVAKYSLGTMENYLCSLEAALNESGYRVNQLYLSDRAALQVVAGKPFPWLNLGIECKQTELQPQDFETIKEILLSTVDTLACTELNLEKELHYHFETGEQWGFFSLLSAPLRLDIHIHPLKGHRKDAEVIIPLNPKKSTLFVKSEHLSTLPQRGPIEICGGRIETASREWCGLFRYCELLMQGDQPEAPFFMEAQLLLGLKKDSHRQRLLLHYLERFSTDKKKKGFLLNLQRIITTTQNSDILNKGDQINLLKEIQPLLNPLSKIPHEGIVYYPHRFPAPLFDLKKYWVFFRQHAEFESDGQKISFYKEQTLQLKNEYNIHLDVTASLFRAVLDSNDFQWQKIAIEMGMCHEIFENFDTIADDPQLLALAFDRLAKSRIESLLLKKILIARHLPYTPSRWTEELEETLPPFAQAAYSRLIKEFLIQSLKNNRIEELEDWVTEGGGTKPLFYYAQLLSEGFRISPDNSLPSLDFRIEEILTKSLEKEEEFKEFLIAHCALLDSEDCNLFLQNLERVLLCANQTTYAKIVGAQITHRSPNQIYCGQASCAFDPRNPAQYLFEVLKAAPKKKEKAHFSFWAAHQYQLFCHGIPLEKDLFTTFWISQNPHYWQAALEVATLKETCIAAESIDDPNRSPFIQAKLVQFLKEAQESPSPILLKQVSRKLSRLSNHLGRLVYARARAEGMSALNSQIIKKYFSLSDAPTNIKSVYLFLKHLPQPAQKPLFLLHLIQVLQQDHNFTQELKKAFLVDQIQTSFSLQQIAAASDAPTLIPIALELTPWKTLLTSLLYIQNTPYYLTALEKVKTSALAESGRPDAFPYPKLKVVIVYLSGEEQRAQLNAYKAQNGANSIFHYTYLLASGVFPIDAYPIEHILYSENKGSFSDFKTTLPPYVDPSVLLHNFSYIAQRLKGQNPGPTLSPEAFIYYATPPLLHLITQGHPPTEEDRIAYLNKLKAQLPEDPAATRYSLIDQALQIGINIQKATTLFAAFWNSGDPLWQQAALHIASPNEIALNAKTIDSNPQLKNTLIQIQQQGKIDPTPAAIAILKQSPLLPTDSPLIFCEKVATVPVELSYAREMLPLLLSVKLAPFPNAEKKEVILARILGYLDSLPEAERKAYKNQIENFFTSNCHYLKWEGTAGLINRFYAPFSDEREFEKLCGRVSGQLSDLNSRSLKEEWSEQTVTNWFSCLKAFRSENNSNLARELWITQDLAYTANQTACHLLWKDCLTDLEYYLFNSPVDIENYIMQAMNSYLTQSLRQEKLSLADFKIKFNFFITRYISPKTGFQFHLQLFAEACAAVFAAAHKIEKETNQDWHKEAVYRSIQSWITKGKKSIIEGLIIDLSICLDTPEAFDTLDKRREEVVSLEHHHFFQFPCRINQKQLNIKQRNLGLLTQLLFLIRAQLKNPGKNTHALAASGNAILGVLAGRGDISFIENVEAKLSTSSAEFLNTIDNGGGVKRGDITRAWLWNNYNAWDSLASEITSHLPPDTKNVTPIPTYLAILKQFISGIERTGHSLNVAKFLMEGDLCDELSDREISDLLSDCASQAEKIDQEDRLLTHIQPLLLEHNRGLRSALWGSFDLPIDVSFLVNYNVSLRIGALDNTVTRTAMIELLQGILIEAKSGSDSEQIRIYLNTIHTMYGFLLSHHLIYLPTFSMERSGSREQFLLKCSRKFPQSHDAAKAILAKNADALLTIAEEISTLQKKYHPDFPPLESTHSSWYCGLLQGFIASLELHKNSIECKNILLREKLNTTHLLDADFRDLVEFVFQHMTPQPSNLDTLRQLFIRKPPT